MINKKIVKKIEEGRKKLRKEMRQRSFTYLAAAFGLVAGLAWNEAVKSLIDYFMPLSTNTILAKFLYAIVITGVVVILTIYLERILVRTEKE